MTNIAITTTTFAKYDKRPLELLKEKGFEIILNPHGRVLNENEVVELCTGASGIIAGTERLDADSLKRLNNLRVISRCGTGLDNIDIDTAKRLGIKIYNTPDAPVLAVAELTIGLILNLLRRISQMDYSIREGKWEKLIGNLLCNKRVGIVGFGRIGKNVAEILKVFKCKVGYVDPYVKGNILEANKMPLDELLKWADIITIHVSTKEGILRKEELLLMKKGSFLVNVSRGGVVDEDALYSLLKSGHLAGAALDVFDREPYTGSLSELKNVILTPHIGSYAKEARVNMEMEAVKNLLKELST